MWIMPPAAIGAGKTLRVSPALTRIDTPSAKEPLINEVGEWNRESCHLGFSD